MKKIKKQKTLDGEISKEIAKVRCEVCGKEFEQITWFHLKIHGMIMHEYREQFPDALLVSEGTKHKMSEAQSGEKNHSYGKTKDTDEGTRKRGEKQSKRKKVFFATEEGQKWLDEHMRGKNNLKYGMKCEKTGMYGHKHTDETKRLMSENHADFRGENHPMYKGGPEKSRARAEEKHRGFGFIPLNEKFPGAEGHHLNKELVLYIPSELHRSVFHNMFTGKGMEKINNLACEYVFGIDTRVNKK